MDPSGTASSPFTKHFPTEPPGPDLSMEAKKRGGGGYPISKNCRLWSKKGKLLSESDREALTCCSCLFILRDPYQAISCGHRYCHTCLEKIMQSSESRCLEDDEVINRNEVCKDRSCIREIAEIEVDCPGKTQGCTWRDLLIVYEAHVEVCVYVMHECKYGCGVQLTRQKLTNHEDQECTKRVITCELCDVPVLYYKLKDHLRSCEYHCDKCSRRIARSKLDEHIKYQCSEEIAQCSIPGCDFEATLIKVNQHISEKHLLHLVHVITQLQDELNKKDMQLNEQMKKVAALENEVDSLMKSSVQADSGFASLSVSEYTRPHPSVVHPSTSGSAVVRGMETRVHSLEEKFFKLHPSIEQIQHDLDHQSSQLAGCMESVQAIQETATRHAVSMEEIKLRQDILDVKTTTGVFIWKIPEIKKRHRDALERRTLSLYSPPFHTSPHGYRICIRAYLNGDGSGRGTHISLFFVLMRSEQDNLLRWPFVQPVTFTLINQDLHPSRNISETFLPDSKSPSFQQPHSEMNVASGFPRFASQSVLRNESYTKGDAIFIKCRVDMKGLPAD